jgi:hypothetical protein
MEFHKVPRTCGFGFLSESLDNDAILQWSDLHVECPSICRGVDFLDITPIHFTTALTRLSQLLLTVAERAAWH